MIEVYEIDWLSTFDKGKFIVRKKQMCETEKECIENAQKLLQEVK